MLDEKVAQCLRELGASPGLLEQRGLELYPDATGLELAHLSQSGREHFLIPAAAAAWRQMRESAASQNIVLVMISGFRSFEHQRRLIRDKLASGQQIGHILETLAPPGCSEHHTGRAADIGTPGCDPLSESFEQTAAFEWLRLNAATFGFRMSYPRGNRWGYRYEPWHWCHAV